MLINVSFIEAERKSLKTIIVSPPKFTTTGVKLVVKFPKFVGERTPHSRAITKIEIREEIANSGYGLNPASLI